jgi:DNA-binding NarL/FixJ family response regulator
MPRRSVHADNASMQTKRPNHVFIVDDSAHIRARLVEMLFEMGGMRVIGEAGCARDAIAGIISTRPDSVLLDLNLLGRSGLDVLRAIRPRLPDTVFVVLTNHSDSQYRQACSDAGAAYFLDKSTEFERVRDVLAQIASTRH